MCLTPLKFPGRSRRAFTLVEILVVIAIIGVLIAILMPALSKARRQAKNVQCQSNLRQIGISLATYSLYWKGWIFPPELGRNVPLDERWGIYVFKPPTPHPPIMLCPSDEEPDGDHTYILNAHLSDKKIHLGSRLPQGLSTSDVIVAGEKVSYRDDYYMNTDDYETTVEHERHGPWGMGANLLFMDFHVGVQEPDQKWTTQEDPWDLPAR